jgi:hypothetical protein
LAPRTKSADKRRDFDPKEFLSTIGEGRKVVAVGKKQIIFTQGDVLTQSSTSRRARFYSRSYPRLARKRPWAYSTREISSEKVAWSEGLSA